MTAKANLQNTIALAGGFFLQEHLLNYR